MSKMCPAARGNRLILEKVAVDRAQVLEVVVPVDRMFLQFEAALQCERVFGFGELNLRLESEQVA